jgi:tRNA (guanine37-N1)-methyltransferase
MQIDVLTLFPGIFLGPLQESILNKARENGLVQITIHSLRDWCTDRHKTADDTPCGGGPGMVIKPEPLATAIETIQRSKPGTKTIFLSPKGKVFTQDIAKQLSQESSLLLICGRYEGIDERIRTALIDEEISIGDYVLNGGELPALVLIEAITRLIPGVVGDQDSVIQDSFYNGLLDYPHYTKPSEFRGMQVPGVLLQGNHREIDQWRQQQANEETRTKRPDLLEKPAASKETIFENKEKRK